MTPSIQTPIIVPVIRPLPPKRDVPPMTTAEIASNSYMIPVPDWAVKTLEVITTPARPYNPPAMV